MPPILIATRGSALALAQANAVLAQCRKKFPKLSFDLKIIKTTGDKLQTARPAAAAALATRALFTKELEAALLERRADLAVHSLKDLPTDLPAGLKLAAVAGQRADVRDVLIYRIDNGLVPRMRLVRFPSRPDRGHRQRPPPDPASGPPPRFPHRAHPGQCHDAIAETAGAAGLDATILAAAGLARLGIHFSPPDGPAARRRRARNWPFTSFQPELMLPCVGQGAIGLEIRQNDERMADICRRLDDYRHLPMCGRRTLLSPRHGRRLSNTHWRLRRRHRRPYSFARRGAPHQKCPARRGQERLVPGGRLGENSRRATARQGMIIGHETSQGPRLGFG